MTRYDIVETNGDRYMEPFPDGEWVRYDEALEEVAKLCEGLDTVEYGQPSRAMRVAAAAIRALIKEQ